MDQIGYSLVDANGNEVRFWGDSFGVLVSAPDYIDWPSGDRSYCPASGMVNNGAQFATRWLDQSVGDSASQSIAFDGTKVVVTRVLAKIVLTGADVDVERDRRIALGASVTAGGATFPVQTRDDVDFRNINGLVSKGIVLTLQGDSTTTVTFRDAANTDHQLAATDLISMGSQVAARVEAIYAASWVIKAMGTIPADYAADNRWPA